VTHRLFVVVKELSWWRQSPRTDRHVWNPPIIFTQ